MKNATNREEKMDYVSIVENHLTEKVLCAWNVAP